VVNLVSAVSILLGTRFQTDGTVRTYSLAEIPNPAFCTGCFKQQHVACVLEILGFCLHDGKVKVAVVLQIRLLSGLSPRFY